MKDAIESILSFLSGIIRQPRLSGSLWGRIPLALRSIAYAKQWRSSERLAPSLISNEEDAGVPPNPLKSYFDSYEVGRGIWKWLHYFDIYHRHFSKFVGGEVHILEIGVYSGGSLHMWREYFGLKCYVYGVDIERACKVYENDWTTIFVGDQADCKFWKSFKEQVPIIDIVIDDGGHETEQQIITLEEMLPHIRPGGVYLCEDIGGDLNHFNSYIYGLASQLNSLSHLRSLTVESVKSRDGDVPLASSPTPFQAAIHSIHLYPFVTVIEKASHPVDEFIAPKHGTEWQPFL